MLELTPELYCIFLNDRSDGSWNIKPDHPPFTIFKSEHLEYLRALISRKDL